jgi:hypothetical protein
MKQILRKLMKKTVEGNTETIVFERIEQEVLTPDELAELISIFCDDYEEAYSSYGICLDFNEDINIIILDTLAEGLSEYQIDEDEEDKNPLIKSIKEKIEPLRAYNLDFEGA